MAHLLSVDPFERHAVERLFAVARAAEPVARRRKVCRALEGAVLGNLFFEASTRTRISFAAAFCRLGGSVCDTTGFTFSSMAKGESIQDTPRWPPKLPHLWPPKFPHPGRGAMMR